MGEIKRFLGGVRTPVHGCERSCFRPAAVLVDYLINCCVGPPGTSFPLRDCSVIYARGESKGIEKQPPQQQNIPLSHPLS